MTQDENTSPRRGRRYALIGGGLVAALVAGYVGTAAAVTNSVPDGTSVDGVPIGGMSKSDAQDAVAKHVRSRMTPQIAITAGDRKMSIDPARAGLSIDASGSVDGLTGFSLAPSTVANHLFGKTQKRSLKPKADLNKLSSSIAAASGTFEGAPVSGSVKFIQGKVKVTRSQPGTGVDADAMAKVVAAGWPAKTSYVAKVGYVQPPLTNAEIDTFVKDFAQPAMSAPVTIKVGSRTAQLKPADISEVLSAPLVDGKLTPTVDAAKLKDLLDTMSGELTTLPVNAHYDSAGKVVEAKDGTEIDPAGAGESLVKALTSSDRTMTLKSRTVKAALTAASLKNLGTTVMGEFTTKLPGGAENAGRTKNIQVAMSRINGRVIAPGEQFSLLQVLMPFTTANGYVDAGVLVDGRHAKGIGGGISQASTTLYNASFFAGLQQDAHTPHSYWISRYPMGREATLWDPTIDLKFTNDSGHPIRISAGAGAPGETAWVKIIGTKAFNVTSNTSAQFDFTEAKTRYIPNDDKCETQTPAPGFSVTVTRRVTNLAGAVVKDESKTTKYIPQDRIICGPAPGASPPTTRRSSTPEPSASPSSSSSSSSSATSKPATPSPTSTAPAPTSTASASSTKK